MRSNKRFWAKRALFENTPKPMKMLHMIAFILLIVGGLNWGILAISGWEVGQLFGDMDAMISKVIYILVGLSALYLALTHKKDCKTCMSKSMSM